MSAIANVRPELTVALRDAVAAGEIERARELEQELLAVRSEARTLPALKRLVADRIEGYPVAVRAPVG
jgi:dihydrodipicolinate synthase/N-acetylneuraminate lyase